jgi:feruloyl-CoA synthase
MTPEVSATRRPDGTILLETALDLPPVSGSLPARLSHWSRFAPAAPYLSEGPAEAERVVTYGEAEAIRRRWSGRLLSLQLSAARPLLILGENGINHALLMLAASAVGLPVAIVSPAYVAMATTLATKLDRVLEQVDPEYIVADDSSAVAATLTRLGRSARVRSLLDMSWLEQQLAAPDSAIDAAEAAVTLDTVAKLLFTSGSTGVPKAVITTQRMMVSNMQALARVWPFLSGRPPVLVDWLPWNHTFGGSCCFNIALWFGGHMHIDRGRPTPALIGRSIEALRRHRPTIYFNVPIGYELLLQHLERDGALAAELLGRLDFIFNAGAALPASLRARLESITLAATGRPANIVGGWGSTETAPFSTVLCFPTRHAANLGVPIPGTTIKMVPRDGRYELRVRGPNVTPGYWRDPETTAAAFDAEGFYCIGDGGRFADPADPAAGIVFDGRMAESFKLGSGTFVNVGALRLAIISSAERLISDVVIAGEGRNELGLMVFANESACRALLGEAACAGLNSAPAASHPRVIERLSELLRAYNATVTGSSSRIARFVVADEPPSAAHDEITDKGYINQRRVLSRRATLIERLYESGIVLRSTGEDE